VSTPNGKIDVAGLAKKNQNKGKRDVSTPNGKIDVAGFAKKKGGVCSRFWGRLSGRARLNQLCAVWLSTHGHLEAHDFLVLLPIAASIAVVTQFA
jgi:hypothetical protein